jgi:hypothetical protein
MYTSSNIIRMTKSRRMRWAGHVTKFLSENLKIVDHLEYLGIDGKIWILGKQGGKCGLGASGSG